MMFDPATGAQIGMPSDEGVVDSAGWAPGSYVEWGGWGCRPAWHDGLPVITDGQVRGFVDTDPNGVVDGRVSYDLVSVSSGYGDPCVAFAGNGLRGTPVTNHVAVWQERLWTWGVASPRADALVRALLGVQPSPQGSWRNPPRVLPPIITQPF